MPIGLPLEASKQFGRVYGFLHLPALRNALDALVAKGVTPADYNKEEDEEEEEEEEDAA